MAATSSSTPLAAPATPDESPADKLVLVNPSYHLVRLNVLSSTQISARTSAIIDCLAANDSPTRSSSSSTTTTTTTPVLSADSPTVTTIVRLSAKAKVGSKLVTIVDISKRELAKQGVKCYQYNALSSVLAQIPRNSTASNDKNTNNNQDDDDEDDAFETMGPADPGTKLRKVPVMTVYLSKIPIKELAAAFG